jgi:hypothetical protein
VAAPEPAGAVAEAAEVAAAEAAAAEVAAAAGSGEFAASARVAETDLSHFSGGPAPPAGGLPLSLLRHQRRPDFVWA